MTDELKQKLANNPRFIEKTETGRGYAFVGGVVYEQVAWVGRDNEGVLTAQIDRLVPIQKRRRTPPLR